MRLSPTCRNGTRYNPKDNPSGPYRWFEDNAMVALPGLGGDRWLIAIDASSGPRELDMVESRWDTGIAGPQTISVAVAPQRYMLLGRTNQGHLQLSFQTPRIVGPGDPTKRVLGLFVQRIKVAPLRGYPIVPATQTICLLAFCMVLLYGLARRLSLDPIWSQMLIFGAVVIAAILLATNRLGLAIALPRLGRLAIGLYLLAILLRPCWR